MGQLSEADNERLLAHPLPTLQWALYDTLKKSDEPIAIFADRGAAMFCNSELYGGTCELREIKLFSDRMPVADPIPAKWRSDT